MPPKIDIKTFEAGLLVPQTELGRRWLQNNVSGIEGRWVLTNLLVLNYAHIGRVIYRVERSGSVTVE